MRAKFEFPDAEITPWQWSDTETWVSIFLATGDNGKINLCCILGCNEGRQIFGDVTISPQEARAMAHTLLMAADIAESQAVPAEGE